MFKFAYYRQKHKNRCDGVTNAFALSGRFLFLGIETQGVALGYVLLPFQGVFKCSFLTDRGIQFPTDCGIQFLTDCGIQFLTDCGIQFLTDCGIQFPTDCGIQLPTDCVIQFRTA